MCELKKDIARRLWILFDEFMGTGEYDLALKIMDRLITLSALKENKND